MADDLHTELADVDMLELVRMQLEYLRHPIVVALDRPDAECVLHHHLTPTRLFGECGAWLTLLRNQLLSALANTASESLDAAEGSIQVILPSYCVGELGELRFAEVGTTLEGETPPPSASPRIAQTPEEAAALRRLGEQIVSSAQPVIPSTMEVQEQSLPMAQVEHARMLAGKLGPEAVLRRWRPPVS